MQDAPAQLTLSYLDGDEHPSRVGLLVKHLARFEPFVFALLVWLAFTQYPHRTPRFSPDSYQYLSSAEQLHDHKRYATSLIHFDTERSHGRIPAPLTWFPPGYPLAIAGVATVSNLPLEKAALVVSFGAFLLTIILLWYIATFLTSSPWAGRIAALLWLTNSHAWIFATSVLSEMLFALLALVFVYCLLRVAAASSPGCVTMLWTCATLLAALCFSVRLAGVILIGAGGAVFLTHLFFPRFFPRYAGGIPRMQPLPTMLGCALALAVILPFPIRNYQLVGDWRGGSITPGGMSLKELIAETPGTLLHLIAGDASLRLLAPVVALFALSILLLLASVYRERMSLRFLPPTLLSQLGVLVIIVSVYLLGIAISCLKDSVSYAPRMFVPILPHVILILVAIGHATLRSRPTGVWVTGILMLFVSLGILHAFSIAVAPPDIHALAEVSLATPRPGGPSAKAWLDRQLPAGAVIAATNGQGAGYILRRRTLSLVGNPYTFMDWTDDALRREAARFHISYVILFRDPAIDPVIEQFSFLASLAIRKPPDWLDLAYETPTVLIYKVLLPSERAGARRPPSQQITPLLSVL